MSENNESLPPNTVAIDAEAEVQLAAPKPALDLFEKLYGDPDAITEPLLDDEVAVMPPTEEDEDDLEKPAPIIDLVKRWLDEAGKEKLLTAVEEVELSKQIEAGELAKQELVQRKGGEILIKSSVAASATDEELVLLAKMGDAARERMLHANLRLVVSIAKHYVNRGLPLLDVIQEGNFGLMRAVDKFNFTKGYKFSTYATWWIRQSIARGIAENGRTVRIPVHMAENIYKVQAIQRRLFQETGREPNMDLLANESGFTTTQVKEMLEWGQSVIALETPIGDARDIRLGDVIADESALDPLEYVADRQGIGQISNVLRGLSYRERTIIELRFGLNGEERQTLQEIGNIFGISRERVRQIEAITLCKLCHPARSAKLTDISNA